MQTKKKLHPSAAVRNLKFHQAINEAIDICMTEDPRVYLIGLGVPDPKGVFGTTLGLQEKHGSHRVMDMPTAENGMTGVAIGSALVGMRPIMVHQRMDFALLAMDQIVNNAAKWFYMYGGKNSVPIVIRLIIGRGWGQGAQHSQSLQAWFAHIPGLKVVMPVTPYDVKGLLIASVEDNNPIIFIEHRWLHNTFGNVPAGIYRVPLGKARIARTGADATVVATSHMVIEALQAAQILSEVGVDLEVIDVRTVRPLDVDTIVESVTKTGHLLVADTGWKIGGFSAEIVSQVTELAFDSLKTSPKRLALSDCPIPTSQVLSKLCYPRAIDIVNEVCEMLDVSNSQIQIPSEISSIPLDIPNSSFAGPF